jgi:hypothetical protein
MRKGLTLFASLLVGACSVMAAETVVLGGDGAAAAVPTVVSDTANATVINFSLDGFVREKETVNGVSYDRISLPSRGTTEGIGFPELPAVNEIVMIPGDAKVRADIVAWNEVTLEGYNVWPFQTPATDFDLELPFVRDEAYYAGGATYPAVKVELGEPGIFRDIRVISLRVNPFRWNPATKQLKVAKNFTIKLTYYGHDTVNTLADTKYRDPQFEPLYRATVVPSRLP